MLAYQHAYHAGNFADVHKHLTLHIATQLLLRKESAITYVDTHAGRGSYPLAAQETRKLMEYRSGILPVWLARSALSEQDTWLSEWLGRLASAQPEADLSVYPGSPWWLATSLRKQDRLSLFELHPGEHRHLEDQTHAANTRHVHGDGMSGLRRMLPVATPRLAVLIDPSYERKEEYQEVADLVAFVAQKARHAIVLVWYPLLPAGRHHQLLESLRDQGIKKLWRSELKRGQPQESHGMYGSGMLVLNPPWGLGEALTEAMQHLTPLLGSASEHFSDWWVGE
ncbi:23S rRNA (adenine(2030)-N(6))-methyltransferase RlmJ [Litchfieldella xinjiangensis]|uniref:23S rRNA (adenine(2030)-N(6))-methyltransferase RlmJ n=1 Tax=Litchfieldella xinjiangensis TaxID=1166948 RepID=UPI0005BA420B|nr:23S rRNA (adenine(2030)-N(6))-methyltransferase RlmJ [Halomonas xinjiangensis]